MTQLRYLLFSLRNFDFITVSTPCKLWDRRGLFHRAAIWRRALEDSKTHAANTHFVTNKMFSSTFRRHL